MPNISPNYTEGIVIIASTALNRTAVPAVVRGTWDLRAKYCGWLHAYIGRKGTAALQSPCRLMVRPALNNDAIRFPRAQNRNSSTVAATGIQVGSTANAGNSQFSLPSSNGLAPGDILVIEPGTATEEYGRIAQFASGSCFLDAPLKQGHNMNFYIYNKADVWEMRLDGGAVWEIIFDYGAATAGPDLTVAAFGRTYNYDVSA